MIPHASDLDDQEDPIDAVPGLDQFDEMLFGITGSSPQEVAVYDNWAVDFALGSAVQLTSVRERVSVRQNEQLETRMASLTVEERNRALTLCRMMARGCFREGVVGTEDMMAAVRAVGDKHPQFFEITDMVLGKLAISKLTQTCTSIPPTLIVGPPGVGKTHFAHDLAAALNVPSKVVTASSSLDLRGNMLGLNPFWKNARMGNLARALIDGNSASPMIILDEADKARADNAQHGLDWAHEALEPNNAARLVDEYLEVPIDASRVIWLLLANSVGDLPESIRDRLMIFEIGDLSPQQRAVVIRSVGHDVAERLKIPSEFLPSDEVLALLAGCSPRQARQALESSYSRAALRGTLALTVADVRQVVIQLRERDQIGVKVIGMTPRARNL
jgi:ATP-dependent Lon protease